MGIKFARFQVSGNKPSLNDLFIKIHRNLETYFETPFCTLWLMTSPLALLGLKTSIIVFPSCSVQFISERELSVSLEKEGNWVYP